MHTCVQQIRLERLDLGHNKISSLAGFESLVRTGAWLVGLWLGCWLRAGEIAPARVTRPFSWRLTSILRCRAAPAVQSVYPKQRVELVLGPHLSWQASQHKPHCA